MESSVGVCACLGIAEAVGRMVSIVEVGMAVGGTLVGSGVGVNATIGGLSGIQAVRKDRAVIMSFFIQGNYMSLRGRAQR
jgi:hypothetical protein